MRVYYRAGKSPGLFKTEFGQLGVAIGKTAMTGFAQFPKQLGSPHLFGFLKGFHQTLGREFFEMLAHPHGSHAQRFSQHGRGRGALGFQSVQNAFGGLSTFQSQLLYKKTVGFQTGGATASMKPSRG